MVLHASSHIQTFILLIFSPNIQRILFFLYPLINGIFTFSLPAYYTLEARCFYK